MHVEDRQDAGWTIREYASPGPGPTVLMLAGGLCTAGFYDDLAAQASVQQASLRLVGATLPGHGGAPPLPDAAVEATARSAGELARRLGCGVVLGHSLGANVAIEMVRLGEFTGPVVLLSPSFSRHDESRFLRAADRAAGLLGTTPYRVLLRLVGPMMKQVRVGPERRAELAEAMSHNDPEALRVSARAYLQHLDARGGVAPDLCGSGVPAWVAFGQHDDVGLRDDERALLDACPDVRLHEIPDAGHLTLNERPDRVADLLIEAARQAAA